MIFLLAIMSLFYNQVTACGPMMDGNEDYDYDELYDYYDEPNKCKQERKTTKRSCIKFIHNGYLYEVLHAKKRLIQNEAQAVCARRQG